MTKVKVQELDSYHIKKLSKIIRKLYPDTAYYLQYDQYTNQIKLTVNLKVKGELLK